ncbi:hypothetical protein [Pseudomonas alkylphenolica]|uniref:Uncharacterized protein n=1 Tax=Pseudomonas alkylphenolica TaxID=237609 RepID=A0A077FFU1_9PSED|nr:hypothetical protein [Pseudomonas alkylphenolica]AIL62116.1 hypothetical protein PSAKL28_29260 [Pseudomonas alkylphenolica]
MALVRLASLPFLLLAPSLPALAYESDFHFGLTYWLAIQAGFDHQQSHDIARGDELTDTGLLDAKHAIIWQLCIKRQEDASKLTRYLHFRAQNPPPALPPARPVDNAEVFAQGQINSVLAEPDHSPQAHLLKLGQALHGWQDSFSHHGVSDHRAPCPEQWVWTHAIDRGGALKHQADRTYVYPFDCREAAKSSYGFLRRYRQAMNLTATAKDWSVLEPQVFAFCQLKTRTAKSQWLQTHSVPQARAIAGNTSLSDGEQRFGGSPAIDLRPAPAQQPVTPTTVPDYERQTTGWQLDAEADALLQSTLGSLAVKSSPQARQWAMAFLQAWLTSPPEQLPQTLAPFFGGRPMTLADQSIDRLLRLRMSDRGLADDAEFAPEKFLGDAQGFITADDQTWRSLLVPPRAQELPTLVGNDKDDELFLIAVLRSAPNAVLILKARSVEQGYAVEGLVVQVFH